MSWLVDWLMASLQFDIFNVSKVAPSSSTSAIATISATTMTNAQEGWIGRHGMLLVGRRTNVAGVVPNHDLQW